MQVESTSKPMLTIDEVEQIRRKKVATIIGHVFQLTYAAFFDKLVQEEKVNLCHGCAIQHPSQRQHSCLMLDTEDAWFYYHDEAREQIDLAVVMKTVKSVCSTLGLKPAKHGKVIWRSCRSCPGPVYTLLLWNSNIKLKIWKNAYCMLFTTAPVD